MIYIDPPKHYENVPGVKFTRFMSSHLISDIHGIDGERELVAFACRIGLRPNWIQRSKGPEFIHFDVMNGRFKKALLRGAALVSSLELVQIINSKRKLTQSAEKVDA